MYNIYPIDEEDIFGVASTTDCTGLIPSALEDDYEREMYEDMYPYYLAEEEY